MVDLLLSEKCEEKAELIRQKYVLPTNDKLLLSASFTVI